MNLAVNLLLFILATTLLAFMLYHLIELPFQKLGKTFLSQKRTVAEPKPISVWGTMRVIGNKKKMGI